MNKYLIFSFIALLAIAGSMIHPLTSSFLPDRFDGVAKATKTEKKKKKDFSFEFITAINDPSISQVHQPKKSLVSKIFIERHSGKNFDSRPISEQQIEALIQSARWSPSSFNDQPWNFIFCNRNTHPEAYFKVLDSIYGQEWVENAPLLVISVARSDFVYNQEENLWAHYDTGAAAMSMSLQATALGLMAHQIGGFDPEAIQEDFHLPEGHQPLTIIAIGYEKPESHDEETRERRPSYENFFFGDWGATL